jgi:hypothetical protein
VGRERGAGRPRRRRGRGGGAGLAAAVAGLEQAVRPKAGQPGRDQEEVEDLADERRLLAFGLAGLARGDLEGAERQRPGDRGLAQADQPLQGAPALLLALLVASAGLGELPQRQGDQPGAEHPEHEPAGRLPGDRLEGAGLVGLGAAARACFSDRAMAW